MRFEDLVAAGQRPVSAVTAVRTPVHTDTYAPPQLNRDLHNAGFVTKVLNRCRASKVRASRRNFMRGAVYAASAAVATGASRFGPARAAEAQGMIVGETPYRIYTACPPYSVEDQCLGCVGAPACDDCCDSNGYFPENVAAGYQIAPGACAIAGTDFEALADGWMWSYNQPCGGCSNVTMRCHDGLKLVQRGDGVWVWFPHICRHVVTCGTAPVPTSVPTSTSTVDAPTPTPTPTDPSQAYTIAGTLVSVVDNGSGGLSVAGWIATQGSTLTNYILSIDGIVVAQGPASLPYNANFPGVGPNHGFSTTINGIAAGPRRVCLSGVVGGVTYEISCLNITMSGSSAATPTPSPVPTATPVAAPTPTFTAVPTPTPTPTASVPDKYLPVLPAWFPAAGAVEVLKLDATGDVFVSGWGANTEVPGPVTLVITVDGADTIVTETVSPRSDVTSVNPRFANALGFALSAPLSPGQRVVCVELADLDTGARFRLACETVFAF